MPAWNLRSVDWVQHGYILLIASSILYFVQALNPYLPSHEYSADDVYYSSGPLDEFDISGWLGIIAACLNVIESLFYIIDWTLERYELCPPLVLNEEQRLLKERISNDAQSYPWYADWNLWGNLLFLVGSIGYTFTSYWYFGKI